AFKWDNATIEYEIVGIVRDVKYLGVDRETEPGFYLPAQQCPLVDMNVLVAVDLPPSEMMGALREAVWSLDAQLPILSMTTMRELFSERIAQPRFTMLLMALFGVIALCLAIVGVYGLISYSVSQRTREIGLRMALGANPGSVLRQVIGRSLGLTLTGIVIGIIAALILTRLLSQMLYDLTPTDPLTFITVPALLLLVAVAAAYVPARRASRIDPMTALRCD
ncbi:MAG: FtsX-like permease family protein, partial [Planctomycetes bacterium]|nr:FtsX-like permease family protein [Planctomycetota bacterium]